MHSRRYDSYRGSGDRATFDARTGVGVDLDAFNLEIVWVGLSNAQSAYAFVASGRRNGVVVTLTRSF